jgi:hypothetical protein
MSSLGGDTLRAPNPRMKATRLRRDEIASGWATALRVGVGIGHWSPRALRPRWAGNITRGYSFYEGKQDKTDCTIAKSIGCVVF